MLLQQMHAEGQIQEEAEGSVLANYNNYSTEIKKTETKQWSMTNVSD